MSNGVIKTKTTAQDGKDSDSNGTVQDSSTQTVYSFRNQTLGSIGVNTNVSFDTERGSDGNMYAINIQSR